MTDQDAAQALVQMADLLTPNAIRAAAALGLADHIDSGADTGADLARRTGSDPAMLGRLLRLLAEIGVLERTPGAGGGPDTFRVGPAGAPLRSTHPFSVAGFLSPTGLFGRAELGFVGLLDCVRTGTPAYRAAFGRDYWDDINHDPAYAPALRAEGARGIGWDAEVVLEAYDWSGVKHVTDVGGNNATLLLALLTAHPHLRGTVLDLPGNAAVAAGNIEAAGLADRATAVAGSFFEPLPTGSDVYLLSGILGDWHDADAVRILHRCAEAAGPDGRVLLADIKVEIPVADRPSAALDLSVAATVAAPSRSPDALAALAARAGLAVSWSGPETPLRSLVELAVTEEVSRLAAVR